MALNLPFSFAAIYTVINFPFKLQSTVSSSLHMWRFIEFYLHACECVWVMAQICN